MRKVIKTAYYILFFSLFLTACKENQQRTLPLVKVKVQSIEYSTIPLIKEYIGITKSVSAVDIRARVEGYLLKKNFKEGHDVQKDQLLFVIDPKPFKARLDHAKAVLETNQAAQEFRHVEYLRMKTLVQKGDVSKERFDKVKAQFDEAKAQVALAQADVEQAEINLSYCYVKAPREGRIGEKLVDVGNLVGGPNKTLLAQVVQLDPIYIEFNPSASDFGEILKYKKNMPFDVRATFPKQKKMSFKGKVNLINNQIDVSTSTVLMRASLENPEKILLPGLYLDLSLILDKAAKRILIPGTAVLDIQGRTSVYVLTADNIVKSKIITIAGEVQGNKIITKGLSVGEKLIVSNIQKIKSGQKVAVDTEPRKKKTTD